MEPVYLISRTGFAPNNGTSVQLARFFAGSEKSVVHLLWDVEEAGAVSTPYSIAVDDSKRWKWPFSRGRGLHARLTQLLQISWWSDDKVSQRKLQRQLRRFPIFPRLAYIVCMREWDARKILSLWHAVGSPPFVLHVMDIFHLGLNERETPAFIELIRRAEHVIGISGLIVEEARRWGAKNTSILPCATDFVPASVPPPPTPLRLVLSGAIWKDHYDKNPALDVLEKAWPEISQRFPHAELHYAGAASANLPQSLRAIVRNHGLLDQNAYQQLLWQCHIAYLAVSHPSDSIGRYSVPSRLVDYLGCGLPTITCTDEQTSTATFMAAVPRTCAANVATPAELLAAIVRFAGDATAFRASSVAAADYTRKNLRIEAVRAELFATLNRYQVSR